VTVAPSRRPRRVALILLVLLLPLAGCSDPRGREEDASPEGAPFIAVVSRGFEHEFWSTVREGSLAAARELGIPLSFDGPATEEMVDVQIDFFQNAVTRKADAVLLAALDSTALVDPVREAQSAGIPVATFDSGVETDVAFHVGTDNLAGGRLAARHLGELMGGEGKVGVVLHDRESETGLKRWSGFSEGMRDLYPRVEILPPLVGGGNPERSAELLEDLLESHAELAGVFAANEGSAVGAAMALGRRNSELPLVGFDASKRELELLREGVIDGLVAQDPYTMGYQGVHMLYSYLLGAELPAVRRTRLTYVTLDNIDDPQVREVLAPEGPKDP